MIRLGVTGTREGLSVRQRAEATLMLTFSPSAPGELHHGDCVGVDAEFHEIALDLGWTVVIHPPADPNLRAWCTGPADRVRVLEPLPYLERDRAIVDATEFLLAAPLSGTRRGGTWFTIGYAEQIGRKHKVLRRAHRRRVPRVDPPSRGSEVSVRR